MILENSQATAATDLEQRPADESVSAGAAVARYRSLHVRSIRDGDELADLRADWNALAGEIPFRRWEWLAPWWNHFRDRHDELLVLTVSDDSGRLVGLAPWFTRATALRGRVIHLLGSGLACSDYVSILHTPSFERSVADALAAWLREEGPQYTWVELSGVSPDDPAIGRFVRRLHDNRHTVDQRDVESSWRIELPDSWEGYLQELSKSRREKVRQLSRRILDTNQAQIYVADSPETVHAGLNILADLHQKRRKSLGQPGCFASPRFRAFLREAAQWFFDAQRLRLQWVELDGRPVVAEIDFADSHTLYMYQSGMDPALAAERPGWLGTIASVRHAIDEGYAYYDFLRGDEPYKAHWRAEPRPLTRIRLFPGTFRALLTRKLSHLKRMGLSYFTRK